MKTQVIISGAGPTGLMMAAQLCRLGIDFIIFDKKDGITTFSKAIGVQARTLEIYDEMGIAQTAVEQGQIATNFKILIGGKLQGGFDVGNLGSKKSPFPYMLILEQSKNEALLQEYVLSFNKSILWEHELHGFQETETGVAVVLKNKNGEEISISAQYLVGCDGASSPIRKKLGFTFEGSTFSQYFYVLDATLDWPLTYNSDIHVCLAKNTFVAFFPMKGDKKMRIIGMLPEGKTDEDDVQFEEIEAMLKREINIPIDIKEVGWYSVYKVHTRMTNSFSKGRCFIAGDAAHIHSPAGGQGMNTGIQDAYNLAWKMAMVTKGFAKETLLDTYNEERLENAKHLLKSTDAIFEAEAGSGWLTSFVRMHIFPMFAGFLFRQDFVKKSVFKLISQTGISYDKHSLSQDEMKNDKINAGDRLPYFHFEDEHGQKQSSYGYNQDLQFRLFYFGNGDLQQIISHNKMYNEPLQNLKIIQINMVKNKAVLEEIFGDIKTEFILLVRPDNYIALQSSEISVHKIKDYLTEKVGIINSDLKVT
jgi:2-polyprenyl-6-methoxyphenol hydroxylase-like FAD-dependent oxidoreductase